MDFWTLEQMRQRHPAWRLLRADHAPLVASFLHRVFIAPNVRVMAHADLVEALEDELYALRERLGEAAFPRHGRDYLNDWTSSENAWLRKFYPLGSDEPQYDLTPSTEKAIGWLVSLGERAFVGTQSRLLILFELLRKMAEGSDADPERRLAELRVRRDELDREIRGVQEGDVPLLDETELRDHFQQFLQMSRELLADFREVEHNFRRLDRHVRERIALWDGSKADLLDEILGARDAIADTDQGRSFRAFWDFLMSSRRQEQLEDLLARVLALPAVSPLAPQPRTARMHHDWLRAGESAQRTVAQLSQQLRRFLDDKAWLENRRIMDILHDIEGKALALRESPPTGDFMTLDGTAIEADLAMERPPFTPSVKTVFEGALEEAGGDDIDTSSLYTQVYVDHAAIEQHIRRSLQDRSQVTLRELCELRPLEQGVAELLAYLQLATDTFRATVDETVRDTVEWDGADPAGRPIRRRARLPRVVYVR